MVQSSAAAAVANLQHCAEQLRKTVQATPEAEATSDAQLAAENAVAAGVAVLADEPAPAPADSPSDRTMLARDLLITVDLVLRSLQAHGEAAS